MCAVSGRLRPFSRRFYVARPVNQFMLTGLGDSRRLLPKPRRGVFSIPAGVVFKAGTSNTRFFVPDLGKIPKSCEFPKFWYFSSMSRSGEAASAACVSFPLSVFSSGDVFIDWLWIRQPNNGRFPLLNDGCVVRIDADGTVVSETAVTLEVEGSHDTSARLRSTESFVELSFNPSRWSRPDNLFGYSLSDCMAVANSVLRRFGMPPFSEGGVVRHDKRFCETRKRFVRSVEHDGYYFVRVDVTANIELGSKGRLDAYLRHLRRQTMPRRKTIPFPSTVVFSQKSSSLTVYDKASEMRQHSVCDVRERIASWCESNGLVRVELRLRERALQRLDMKRGATHADFVDVFLKEVSKLSVRSVEQDVGELSPQELAALCLWQRGFYPREVFSKNTFYKYRKAILCKTGCDIGGEPPVRFEPRREQFSARRCVRPEWYQLPEVV